MTETIVVGTDGSASGTRAVTWAAREAARQGAPLRVVYALPKWAYETIPGSRYPEIGRWWRSEAQRLLGEAVDQAGHDAPGTVIDSAVLPGDPVPVLLAEAARARVAVVGSHGLGEMRGLLLGSVGLKLAGRTPCPLVVVRDVPDVVRNEIVVGVDGSAGSAAALEFAFEEATRRKASIRAIRAWSLPMPPVAMGAPSLLVDIEEYTAEATEALSASLAPWRERYPAVKIEEEVVWGHPVRTIEDASAAADLVVVGSRGLGGFAGLVLGSVGHGVLHHARCPVAIVAKSGPE